MDISTNSYKKNRLSLLIGSAVVSSGLLVGCSSDGGSSSASSVAVDSSVPPILQSGKSAQGTVALVSTSVASVTSVDSEAADTRTVNLNDSSICPTKLSFTPSSLQVTVDGDAVLFNVTAPAGNCLHQISFSGDGITTSTSTADINVVQNAIVTVGLFDSNDVATVSVAQGGILKIKFSSPTDWENVTGEQSYTVSSDTNGITYTNNPCTLIAPQAGTCTVTATIGENVATGAHGFNITPSSTSVPVDVEDNTPNLPFTVNTLGQFAFTGEGVTNNEVVLTIGADPMTITITNSGGSTITNINSNTGNDADKFDVTDPGGDEDFCGDIDSLAPEASCELNLALSDQAEADTTYDFEVTGDNASTSPAILTVNTEADASNFTFITNYGNSTVTRCAVNEAGEFSGCEEVANNNDNGLNHPAGIILNTAEDMAFIANRDNNDTGTVTRCTVDEAGYFSACTSVASGPAESLDSPYGIILNTAENLVYITNFDSSTITRCAVNEAGDFSACTSVASGPDDFLGSPRGIILNTAENMAFIADSGSNTITRCAVNEVGDFSGCAQAINPADGVVLGTPYGIILNTAENMAFITEYTGDTITRCAVDEVGNFSACASIFSPDDNLNNPVGIILNTAGDKAFITVSGNNTVRRCAVNELGDFSNCTPVANEGEDGLVEPYGIYLK